MKASARRHLLGACAVGCASSLSLPAMAQSGPFQEAQATIKQAFEAVEPSQPSNPIMFNGGRWEVRSEERGCTTVLHWVPADGSQGTDLTLNWQGFEHPISGEGRFVLDRARLPGSGYRLASSAVALRVLGAMNFLRQQCRSIRAQWGVLADLTGPVWYSGLGAHSLRWVEPLHQLKMTGYSPSGAVMFEGVYTQRPDGALEWRTGTHAATYRLQADGAYLVIPADGAQASRLVSFALTGDRTLRIESYRVHDGVRQITSGSTYTGATMDEALRAMGASEGERQAAIRAENAKIAEMMAAEQAEQRAWEARSSANAARARAQAGTAGGYSSPATSGAGPRSSTGGGGGEAALVGSSDPWYSPEAKAAREAKWDAASAAARARQEADAAQLARDNAAKAAADAAKPPLKPGTAIPR